jgi:hypothetical protein
MSLKIGDIQRRDREQRRKAKETESDRDPT